jgi:hypothetical protein
MTFLWFEVISNGKISIWENHSWPLEISLLRKFRKGFQRTYHFKLRSGDAVKNLFATWNSFISKLEIGFWGNHSWPPEIPAKKVLGRIQRTCHSKLTSGEALKTLFGTWHSFVSNWFHLESGYWENLSWSPEISMKNCFWRIQKDM